MSFCTCRPSYETLRSIDPSYVEEYVPPLYSGIREPNGQINLYNPYDQCFCKDRDLLQIEEHKTGITPIGKCYPVNLCKDCDINLSGMCQQQNKYDSLIDDPYWEYSRLIYYRYEGPYYPPRYPYQARIPPYPSRYPHHPPRWFYHRK